MSRLLRVLPWAIILIIGMSIAFAAPHQNPRWLPRLALVIMGFGGAFNLIWAIVGIITRRLSRTAALGAVLIGVGLILYGSQWLPGHNGGGPAGIAGLALGILGMMLQISGMQEVRK